ncbi:MAG: hypothetical protein JKY71_03935 [Alphaproteobacteria bacterium]|nr:hypothetical protein [Alphaproteobacteria bacterium]
MERNKGQAIRIVSVLVITSLVLSLVNPFADSFITGFLSILGMYGFGAISYHTWAQDKGITDLSSYNRAGMLLGIIYGLLYALLLQYVYQERTPIGGYFAFAFGGVFLGSACSMLFWQTVVKPNTADKTDKN